MSTVAMALAAARARLPAAEARLLLGHALGRPAAWLFAHDNDMVGEAALRRFASLVTRRTGGEPVAYLIGYREFYDRDFAVSPAVLIPRPETELLVETALAQLGTGARILDLGTGSGCIAITLALENPGACVSAVDASEGALDVARGNAQRLGANVRLLRSNWFAALADERFDLIVANPPYVAAGDPHLASGDLRHEPVGALVGGDDGLDAIRHIAAHAPEHLARGGQLWLEHGYDQAPAVRAVLAAAGLEDIEQHVDLAGIVRVSGGRRP